MKANIGERSSEEEDSVPPKVSEMKTNLEERSNEEEGSDPPKVSLRENEESAVDDIKDETSESLGHQFLTSRLLRRGSHADDPCSEQTAEIKEIARKIETMTRNTYMILDLLGESANDISDLRGDQKKMADTLEFCLNIY